MEKINKGKDKKQTQASNPEDKGPYMSDLTSAWKAVITAAHIVCSRLHVHLQGNVTTWNVTGRSKLWWLCWQPIFNLLENA